MCVGVGKMIPSLLVLVGFWLKRNIFVNKSKLNLIQHKIDFHKKNGGGGICDMTFFYLMDKLTELDHRPLYKS